MISEEKSLEEITKNVFSKIKFKEICLPSNYLEEFNSEVKESKLMDLVTKRISKDLDRSQNLLEKTYEIINETRTKVCSLSKCDSVESFIKKEMQDLLKKINDLSSELHFDELTGAKNRRWLFKTYLNEEKCFKENGVMVFMDLNNFKDINDTFGHITGDKALVYFVSFLKKEMSKYIEDFKIIRFAGDEFILLFNNSEINSNKVKNIMQAISLKMEKQKLKPANSSKNDFFKVGFSYGVVEFNSGSLFSEVIETADSGMYLMKSVRKEERSKK